MKKIYSRSLILILIVLVVGIVLLSKRSKEPGKLDQFVGCLKDRDAVFYGAFWCPHCQNQKKLFGNSQKFLSYVECSTPDGSGQLPICKEKGISAYPTWEFSDDSKESGELSLEFLSNKTGCELPR